MDIVLEKELTRIFPKADDVTIKYNISEAKRLANDNFDDVLTLAIDLLLDGPQNMNPAPKDDIIYVGLGKNPKAETVYDGDESDIEEDLYNESTVATNHRATPAVARAPQKHDDHQHIPTVVVDKHTAKEKPIIHINATNARAQPTPRRVMEKNLEKYQKPQRPNTDISTSTICTPTMKKVVNSSTKQATSINSWLPNTPMNTPVASTTNKATKMPVIQLERRTIPNYGPYQGTKEDNDQEVKTQTTGNIVVPCMPGKPWVPITPPPNTPNNHRSGDGNKAVAQPKEHLTTYDTKAGTSTAGRNATATKSYQANSITKAIGKETMPQCGRQSNQLKAHNSSISETGTPSVSVSSNLTTPVINIDTAEGGTNTANVKSGYQKNWSPSSVYHPTSSQAKTIGNDHRLPTPTRLQFSDSCGGNNLTTDIANDSQTSDIYEQVREIFPTVQQETLNRLRDAGYNVDQIVDHLLKHPELLKHATHETVTTPVPPTTPSKTPINYYKKCSEKTSHFYRTQCFTLLKNEFTKLYVVDIRAAMRKFNGHYAATRKHIKDKLAESDLCDTGKCLKCKGSTRCMPVFQKLGAARRSSSSPEILDADLVMEIEFVKEQEKVEEENRNLVCAQEINEKQYEDEGQLIECGCCFGEYPFEEVVQCTDAHLFCSGCLKSYAKEVIFGSAISQAQLMCMTSGCTQTFPYSQLTKVLSSEEIAKYQDRLQQECLIKADLPDLVECPFCDFKAIVPENGRVFYCLREDCLKESCRHCGEEWKDHVGLKCSEVEKKCQTNLRVSYEEKMTLAKIRVCGKCSCQFTKSEGCNKMTCRCGQTMCYICRKACISYNHFCRHPREPGQKCTICTACSLWTNATEDDELVVKELEKEAKAAKRKLEDELGSDEKKQKTE